jgi:arylsulfatase A-like enzyme
MSRPNVIVFFTDQQRWDTTGVHGNPLELTPNFDRLATHGTHVAHSFTCQPVCGPARACLQTGQYPTRLGCWRNAIPLPAGVKTLAHHFRAGGYTTGYIGKWHLAPREIIGAVPAPARGGYEYWLAANVLEYSSEAYRTRLYDHDDREVVLPGYRVDALTDAAIRYLAQPREQPYFLFLSFLEPHHQNAIDDYPPPTGYRARYTGRWVPADLAALGGSTHQHLGGYYGMIKRLDEALGRLLDALQSLGQLANTILLYTSDHGCHFKTRNGEYKRSCHESSIRVPTAFRGPGFDGGGRLRQLVSLIDLPPTLLDAAGLPVPNTMQGRSLLPLLRSGTAPWPDDLFVQISESQVGRALRTARWKYSVSAPDRPGNQHAHADRYVEEFLYDLEADPHELRNLVKSHRAVRDELRARLLRRMEEAGEPPATIDAAV